MLKKSVSMFVVALFVLSFIAVAAVSADETQKITGTVDSFNPATNELTIKDDAGDVKKLTAGPDIDMESLKNLKQGDPINLDRRKSPMSNCGLKKPSERSRRKPRAKRSA